MGCLPWIVGGVTGLVVGSATQSGWAGFLLGVAVFLLVLVLAKIVENEKQRRTSRVPPTEARAHPPEVEQPERKPVWTTIKFEDIQAGETTEGNNEVDIEGISDAYTGESLDSTRGVWQCPNCKACYHSDTIEFLKTENEGRCVNFNYCKGTQFTPVAKTAAGVGAKNFSPSVVSLENYRLHIGRVVTFEGYVPRINVSSNGSSVAIMFEDATWSKGLKAVVLGQSISDAGGRVYLRSLRGHTIRVRGLLENHALFGPQILVTRRSMISEVTR